MEGEQATRAKKQHDSMLAGASESRSPAHTEGTTPITEVSNVFSTQVSSEREPSYKGVIAELETDT